MRFKRNYTTQEFIEERIDGHERNMYAKIDVVQQILSYVQERYMFFTITMRNITCARHGELLVRLMVHELSYIFKAIK